MPEDHRVLPLRRTPRERLSGSWDAVEDHIISLKDLWPTPADYADLPRSWGKDLVAGLTVGIVALPLALGFGVASGMGAAAGLITAVVAGAVAAIFGGSHLQVSGPTGAMTVVLLPVIAHYGLSAVPLLAVMAGLMVVALGLTGLGRSVDILPWPVIEGFTMGIGIIIALQQIPLVVGGPKGEAESTLVASYETLVHTDWSRSWQPLTVCALVVALHLVGRRFLKRVPIALVSIVVATLLVELAGWDVARIGALPSSLPMPSLPDVSLDTIRTLVAPAVAVATLASLESLLSARIADGLRPDLSKTNPDRELVGQGLANIASGLFGGLPATGAIARTAVNVRAGTRTRLSSLSHAVVLLVVMLVLAPIVGRVPMASLGGVLLVVALRMVHVPTVTTVFRTTRADRNTFLITLAATVLLDLVAAVLLGLAMAALMSIRHMARYSIVRRQHLPADTPRGPLDLPAEREDLRAKIALFRVDGALFYGDGRRFIEVVTGVEDVDVVIIRFHRTNVIDASGGEALKEVAVALQRRGISLVVQGMTHAQLQTAVAMQAVTPEQHHRRLEEALAAAVVEVDRRESDGDLTPVPASNEDAEPPR